MRTALGLLGLGIVGGIAPVGSSVLLYLTPLVTGTVVAFLVLLTLSVVISALRHRSPRRVKSSSQPSARSGPAVPAAAPRTT